MNNVYILSIECGDLMSQKMRAPKRRIERIHCDIATTLSTGVTELVLHTVEDSKTLVRVVADLIQYSESNAGTRSKVSLQVQPGSVVVRNPIISQQLDVNAPATMLFEFPMYSYGDTTSATAPAIVIDHIQRDSKAMRKLKAGDEIAMRTIGSSVNGIITGTVELWFKE